MNTFGTISPNNYVVEDFYASTILKWRLISGSTGTRVVELEDLPDLDTKLDGAVTVTRAINDFTYFNRSRNLTTGLPNAPINVETGVPEYLLYKSVANTFYTNNCYFISASVKVTQSITPLPDNSYIISIGQDFYGERIKPGTFTVKVSTATTYIFDDFYGNLYISQSGVGTYVGNIFYDYGVAVVKQHTGSTTAYIGPLGIKLINGTNVQVEYGTDVKINRHQINVVLRPTDFNFSIFNPSTHRAKLSATGSLTQSLNNLNIAQSGSNTWAYSSLMRVGLIKPYVTTIGLYNDQYELLAVAKLSTPIQRTFDTDQIFIVRFDT